jgi:hypothetical protein
MDSGLFVPLPHQSPSFEWVLFYGSLNMRTAFSNTEVWFDDQSRTGSSPPFFQTMLFGQCNQS